ncbi:hypothetical protein QRX60_31035 [Amycolatopsis mongoliensis]|uniref:Uncharacterized protein n=1 Tax=Amycolatopsis mongoliensis TaxID=715475 RepID=A0A9Y2JKF9_9PSEU|nr:hypothetical protein [Amycolatopsis sp. 4-36]WIX98488.1 hypothetical protein QRX60_31035 [Amycolatopsis sp. 4-36]
MSRSHRERRALRELGHRRARVVVRSAAVAGTGLAVVFGVVLAQHPPAKAAPAASPAPVAPRPATGVPAAPPTTAVPPSSARPAPATTTAPRVPRHRTLQPPPQPPVVTTTATGSTGGS